LDSQGRGCINPGISREGGIQALEFQERSNSHMEFHGISRWRSKFNGMEIPWEEMY
jgi:hypothetical protein